MSNATVSDRILAYLRGIAPCATSSPAVARGAHTGQATTKAKLEELEVLGLVQCQKVPSPPESMTRGLIRVYSVAAP